MKDTNFTPGKWAVCEDVFGEYVVNESGDHVCEVCSTTDDARLIAAAPLLYQAAEKAVAEGECTGPSDTHHCHLIMEDIAKWCGHCQLDHAIAAAKGKT